MRPERNLSKAPVRVDMGYAQNQAIEVVERDGYSIQSNLCRATIVCYSLAFAASNLRLK